MTSRDSVQSVQLVLPFTEALDITNQLLWRVKSPLSVAVVQRVVDEILVKEFGSPRPESSEE